MATRRDVTEKKAVLLREIHAAHRSGQWAPGEAVPALTELAARYGLSKRIVNEELDVLVAEGLLFKVPRVGTFVAHAPVGEFEFYLLALDDEDAQKIGNDAILMQIRHGFEEQIAGLGGSSLVMSVSNALENARAGALPPIAGVFRYGGYSARDLAPAYAEFMQQRGGQQRGGQQRGGQQRGGQRGKLGGCRAGSLH